MAGGFLGVVVPGYFFVISPAKQMAKRRKTYAEVSQYLNRPNVADDQEELKDLDWKKPLKTHSKT